MLKMKIPPEKMFLTSDYVEVTSLSLLSKSLFPKNYVSLNGCVKISNEDLHELISTNGA